MTRARDLADSADKDISGTLTLDGLTVSGNVGIADNSPPSRLTVLGDNSAAPASNGAGINGIQVTRTTSSSENLYIYTAGNFTGWSGSAYSARIEGFGLNALEIGTRNSKPVVFATDNTARVTINSSGNVGIGTTGPEKRLHIFDSTQTNQTVRLGNPDAAPYGEINYNSTGSEHLYITSKGTIAGYGNIVFQTGGTPSEAMRIDSSGGVSIGTGASATGIHSLAKVLEISGGDGGDLIIGNNASSNIGAGAHVGAIAFKNIDSSTGSVPHYAGIRCESADTSGNMDLRFYTGIGNLEADTPQAIIDSSGKLLVGKDSSDYAVEGVEIRSNEILITKAGANPLSVRNNGNGGLISLNSAGATIGSIGVVSSDILYVATPDGTGVGLNFDGDSSKINPCNGTGSGTDGVADLGNSSGRFKDLYLSGGVYLGGTGSANFLDDYEEGTFDVTLTTTGGSVTLNSVYNKMSYTKVGRMVTVFGLIITSGVSSPTGAYAHFDTLPFASANLTEGSGRSGGGVFYWDGSNPHVKPWEISEGSTRLSIYIDASTLTSGDDFYFSCTYQAA